MTKDNMLKCGGGGGLTLKRDSILKHVNMLNTLINNNLEKILLALFS